MKEIKIPRHADLPPLLKGGEPDEEVTTIPIDDQTTEVNFFVAYRDGSGFRAREYVIGDDGELSCAVDREAIEDEIYAMQERVERAWLEGTGDPDATPPKGILSLTEDEINPTKH